MGIFDWLRPRSRSDKHPIAEDAFPPTRYEEARDRLLPAVRSRASLECARLEAQIESGEEIEREQRDQLGEALVISVVYDGPTAFAHVARDDVARWSVSPQQLLDCALANLRARSDGAWIEVGPGVFESPWKDELDGARLLLPDVVGRAGLRGPAVAVVPSSTSLLIAERDQPASIESLAERVRAARTSGRRVGAFPLIRIQDNWTDWCSDHEPPLPNRLAALALDERLHAYAQQRPALQRWVGESIYVAEPILSRTPGGELVVTAVLAEGVPTLLPCVDMIQLMSTELLDGEIVPDEASLVEWDYFTRAMGKRLEPTDDFPPRWIAYEYPNATRRRAMQGAGTHRRRKRR